MAVFTVQEVCQATGAVICSVGNQQCFNGVSTDTRTICAGELFIALQGENFDGHFFVEKAVAQGAAGVLSAKIMPIADTVTLFKVPDTLVALQKLAGFHRKKFLEPVIAVTGSNGKTSTKDMIAAVLSSNLIVLKSEANFNNEIGLPMTLLQIKEKHQVAVVEMGMRGRGEIADLADIAKPTIGVVTNVGETHLERLGSLENIAAAKSELIESLSSGGVAVLNYDDELVRAMAAKCQGRSQFYGLSPQADVFAQNVRIKDNCSIFSCRYKDQDIVFEISIPFLGKHNVYNALAAVTVGKALGLSPEKISQGLRYMSLTAMRQEIIRKNNYTVINDAYNASPLSMAAAIDVLSATGKGRKLAVLGDMLELGPVAEEAHKRIGLLLSANKIDIVITVGQLAQYIADSARSIGVTSYACDNHEQAQKLLKKIIQSGDTVLVKGSRGMKMETVLSVFSEID